jgi:hypothetical protein
MKKIEKWGAKSLETLAEEHYKIYFDKIYNKISNILKTDENKIALNVFLFLKNIINEANLRIKIEKITNKTIWYNLLSKFRDEFKSILNNKFNKDFDILDNNQIKKHTEKSNSGCNKLMDILLKLINDNQLVNFKNELLEYFKVSFFETSDFNDFIFYIFDNAKQILAENEESLCQIREKYEDIILIQKDNNTRKDFDTKLKEIFDYDANQYQIKEILTSNQKTLLVCPYCNINYIAVTKAEDSNTKYLFVLDHFYDKATHPYFALSFYNLVPCCHTCNSSFKGSKDFSIKTHIHPYVDDFDSIARFSLPLTKENLQQFLVPNSSIKVEDTDTEAQKEAKKLKIKLVQKGSEEDFKRAKHNEEDFLLEKRYELHQDYINEILIKAYAYPDDYLESIQKTFPKLFEGAGSTEQMKRLIWGNYTQPEDINRRPLAKLTQDIMDELGLHKILKTNNLDTTQREG